ncbi:hypothetical protein GUJ93_ZPchr0013g34143 [Zizania palustris]|uniref:Uncharacterized protein n=1 Tax=Zizania palustris TaxID=103762 RepID=A0A8J5WVT3_ZIZPA|nr:hypothetical protein GUJ93_ZPchr0013g34143 [Zizania palustris]
MPTSAEPRCLASRVQADAPRTPSCPRRINCTLATFNARRRGAAEVGRRGGGGSAKPGTREVRRQGSTEADARGGETTGDQGRAWRPGRGLGGWWGRSAVVGAARAHVACHD